MKKILLYIVLIFMTILLLINPQQTIEYALSALDLCRNIIVPSLFPFFVCSGLLIYSGFCEIPAKVLQPIMKPIFNVNGAGATAFVLGIISGYPLGAISACQLYEKNYLSKAETERLLSFCNNSGPLFILGAVGVSLYHSPKIGFVLYASHILSALLTGIIFRFYRKDNFSAPSSTITVEEKDFSEIFSAVLANSIQSILTVCGAILFFSVIAQIFVNIIPISDNLRNTISGFLEFTTGIANISKSNFSLMEKLVLSSVIVGFAGLSVHMQVMSVVSRYKLSMFPYIVGKIIQAVISSVSVFLLMKFIPKEITTISLTSPEIGGAFAMTSVFVIIAVTSIFFIALSGIVFVFFRQRYKNRNAD